LFVFGLRLPFRAMVFSSSLFHHPAGTSLPVKFPMPLFFFFFLCALSGQTDFPFPLSRFWAGQLVPRAVKKRAFASPLACNPLAFGTRYCLVPSLVPCGSPNESRSVNYPRIRGDRRPFPFFFSPLFGRVPPICLWDGGLSDFFFIRFFILNESPWGKSCTGQRDNCPIPRASLLSGGTCPLFVLPVKGAFVEPDGPTPDTSGGSPARELGKFVATAFAVMPPFFPFYLV